MLPNPTAPAGPAVAALPPNAKRLPIPAAAVGQWLAAIDDLAELKVTLRTVGIVSGGASRKGVPASAGLHELLEDAILAKGIASGHPGIVRGLGAALRRGTLAAARHQGHIRIYLNDDAAQQHFRRAELTPLTYADIATAAGTPAEDPPPVAMQPPRQRANIFALYEQHIGSYGHSTAEQLRAAEQEYSARWIEYAFADAAKHNARSWSYVIATLRRWEREGLPDGAVDANDAGKSGNGTAPDDGTEYLESYRRRYGRLPWESGDDSSANGG